MQRDDRAGGGRARATRRTAATAATVLLLGGCTGPSSDQAATGAGAVPMRISGPLAAGFEIEPGSALVGAVFRHGEEGLRAVLRVDGDLPDVFERYVRQAGELGFPVSPSAARPAGQWCVEDPEEWEYGGQDMGAFSVDCSASGHAADRWSMSLHGLADPDGAGYIEIIGGALPQTAPEPDLLVPLVPDGPVAPLTDVELAPGRAAPDEPVDVVQGSALLMEPLPNGCWAGYTAVLEVAGELAPVMRSYREQYRRPISRLALRDDGRVQFFREYYAGGGSVGVVGLPGEPAHILIDRCHY
jgi:hypothetical protein